MKGSVRKKGATWSYRIDLGTVSGKRNQIERSGFKTKREAEKAMSDSIHELNNHGELINSNNGTQNERVFKFRNPIVEFKTELIHKNEGTKNFRLIKSGSAGRGIQRRYYILEFIQIKNKEFCNNIFVFKNRVGISSFEVTNNELLITIMITPRTKHRNATFQKRYLARSAIISIVVAIPKSQFAKCTKFQRFICVLCYWYLGVKAKL